jgi:hypothetical protein
MGRGAEGPRKVLTVIENRLHVAAAAAASGSYKGYQDLLPDVVVHEEAARRSVLQGKRGSYERAIARTCISW